jgi:hypothetical protein
MKTVFIQRRIRNKTVSGLKCAGDAELYLELPVRGGELRLKTVARQARPGFAPGRQLLHLQNTGE